MDLKQLERAEMLLDLRDANSSDLVQQAVELMRSMAQSVRVELATRSTSVSLRVDTDRMQQVLTNLLSAAIKFSPPDARIEISTGAEDGEVRYRGPKTRH